jgi:hypothetical protein
MLSRYLRFFEKNRKRLIALRKMEASLEADRYQCCFGAFDDLLLTPAFAVDFPRSKTPVDFR